MKLRSFVLCVNIQPILDNLPNQSTSPSQTAAPTEPRRHQKAVEDLSSRATFAGQQSHRGTCKMLAGGGMGVCNNVVPLTPSGPQ